MNPETDFSLKFIEKEKVFDSLKVYQIAQDSTPLSKRDSTWQPLRWSVSGIQMDGSI